MPRILINIDVPDIDAGVRFYTEGLGLHVGRRLGEDFIELLGAEAPLYLLRKRAGTEASPVASASRDYARHWTPVHLDFAVDDLERAVERARAAGATLEAPISTHPYGRLALLADPFGHGLCLIELNETGYDAIATG